MVDLSNKSISLTEAQVEEFQEAFGLFDKDGNGCISVDELGVVLKALGRTPTQDELKAMIGEADEDGSGQIEFPEFLKLMAAKLHDMDSVEELQEAFSVFDRDKSGQVTASELKHVMNSLGEKVTNEEVEQMIAEADIDGDGELSVDDFIQFVQMKSLNSRQ
ncbi:unnamed protein product [Cladocopium goreaui]|uniref:Calmodulin n=1 Tax=Cladocopium goreaui TaxID=2562237 RepID=A0A9P1FDP6_9DINO|nr:unnamed protein product [Cladocopium goreaui]|mmetsp:Transcript_54441/g.119141  ORF Transcript_54441/g.119141 Transcript_54441/m.119141 type:complete len:162 (+) Transcript_54441:52-537(+)